MSATPEQWAEAREAYEAGESARSIARRLGLHHSAVARQAKREGWRGRRGAGGAGGAAARSGAPDPPAEEQQPTRTDDLGLLLAGNQRPPFDSTTPAGQRRILEACGLVPRRWPDVEARIERLAEDQREAEAERRGYRGAGWLRRAGF